MRENPVVLTHSTRPHRWSVPTEGSEREHVKILEDFQRKQWQSKPEGKEDRERHIHLQELVSERISLEEPVPLAPFYMRNTNCSLIKVQAHYRHNIRLQHDPVVLPETSKRITFHMDLDIKRFGNEKEMILYYLLEEVRLNKYSV